jgi:hypothetical protein
MRKEWVLVACLLLVAPTYALAAPQDAASKDFPNDLDLNGNPGSDYNVAPASATGNLSIHLKLRKNCPRVDTPKFALTGLMEGEEVARLGANELCKAALAAGYTTNPSSFCLPLDPNGTCTSPCVGLACCGATKMQTQTVVLDYLGPGACNNRGFKILRTKQTDKFEAKPRSGNKNAAIVSLLSDADPDAGNTVTTDLLPNWIVQVDPIDANGPVGFGVATKTDPNACSFTVDTTGKDPWLLHGEIAQEYGNCPLTPQLNCMLRPPFPGEGSGSPPGTFGSAPFVFCANVKGAKVIELTVDGRPGQAIVTETTAGLGGEIPTLSPWGMALLVVTLLLLGTWMLRRRRLDQRT